MSNVLEPINKNNHRVPSRRSPVALFTQVHDTLLSEFEAGEWIAGDVFPTVSELTKRFGVSSITIRRVLRDLTENGYLLTSQGARTTVADRRDPTQRSITLRRNIAIPFYAGAKHMLNYARGPWTATLVTALQHELMDRGYSSSLLPFDVNDTAETLGIHEDNFDGLLVLAGSHTEDALWILSHNLPSVSIGKPNRPAPSNYVTASFYNGGADVAKLMQDKDIKKFLYLMHPGGTSIERMRGFQETLLINDVPSKYVDIILADGIEVEDGYRAVVDFLKKNPFKERLGIFGAGDFLASGACRACHELGVSIPAQAIVIGGSGLPEAADYNPPLSSLCYPFEEVAVRAIDMLFRLMTTGAKVAQGVEIPMSLKERYSTG